MIGVDTSQRPATWAAWTDNTWCSGPLPDGTAMPAALKQALAHAQIRSRDIALCIATEGVVIERLAGRLSASRAGKAARLNGASRFRMLPAEIVASVDKNAAGCSYVAAPRAVIQDQIAPWLEAGFRVPIVEPAAVTLLRGAACETIHVIVRMGQEMMDVVVGSADRCIQTRQVALEGAAPIERVRLEIETTIDDVRRGGAGVDVDGVLLCGVSDVAELAAGFGGRILVAPYRMGPIYGTPEPPTDAVAAAGVALWRKHALGAPRGRPVRLPFPFLFRKNRHTEAAS